MQDTIVLRTVAGDEAQISLHGAQLLSWIPGGGQEQVYLSPLSHPGPGVAVRGGAPICWPQFSQRGPLPKHGIARTSRWQLLSPPGPQATVAEARFQLDSRVSPGAWKRDFCLVMVARLGEGWLEMHLQAANTGRTAWSFTAAIHTYFAVPDLRQVEVAGLQGLAYEDMVDAGRVHTEAAPALRFDGSEIDRVYRGVNGALALRAEGMRERRISQQGFSDVVVWNPGPAKATALGDLPRADWQRMLCIEAGAIAQPVEVPPGKTWSGLQRIDLA